MPSRRSFAKVPGLGVSGVLGQHNPRASIGFMGANEPSAVHTGGGPSTGARSAGHLMAMLDSGISAAELETTLSVWLDGGAIDQPTAAAARRLNSRLWEANRR